MGRTTRAASRIRALILVAAMAAVPLTWGSLESSARPVASTAGITRGAGPALRPGRALAERAAATDRSSHRSQPGSALLVRVTARTPIRSEPGAGRLIGWVPAVSRYYHAPIVAWVRRTSADGRYGLLAVPYSAGLRSGWIALRGMRRTGTRISVQVDLSRHLLTVMRGARPVAHFPAATGAPSTPTPTGRYFVTDRVPFSPGSAYGSFAFGISGIQSHLPAGWWGGDQLAIHGTSAPSTIGTSASAGCLRVSEQALARLRPLLRPGTPVIVRP